MKTISKFTLALFMLSIISTQLYAVHNPQTSQDAISIYLDQEEVDANAFLDLKIKDIKKAVDKKVTLKDRIVFNITKFKVAKELRKNSEFNNADTYYKVARGSFNLGGFLLGFFLPIIGNLIALLFGRNAFRSSLIGTLTAIIAGLIGWAI